MRAGNVVEWQASKQNSPDGTVWVQVTFIGACLEHKPWLLVLEFMPYGNLKSVLQVRACMRGFTLSKH